MNSTKASLCVEVAEVARFTQLEAYETITQFLEVVGERLAEGETIQIRGFATLWPVERKPRPARNPRNGDPYLVPARTAVKFRPSAALKAAMNGVLG